MNLQPVIPDSGLHGIGSILVTELTNGGHGCKIRLYANDYWPVPETVATSFDELSGAGYLPKNLPMASDFGVDVTRRDIWLFPELVWTATGAGLPVTAYGYWVDFDDPLTGTKRTWWAQRFQAPQILYSVGQTIKFAPSFGVKQC